MFRNEKHATTGPLARLRPQGEACAFLFDRRPRFIDALPVSDLLRSARDFLGKAGFTSKVAFAQKKPTLNSKM